MLCTWKLYAKQTVLIATGARFKASWECVIVFKDFTILTQDLFVRLCKRFVDIWSQHYFIKVAINCNFSCVKCDFLNPKLVVIVKPGAYHFRWT